MKISLLVIASEILEGKVQDINTLNLSKLLKSQSHTLEQVITVSDHQDHITCALEILSSSDLVVISGGMGPTPDDLTKGAIALFLNAPLISSEESSAIAAKNYQNRGRAIPSNHPYQMIPQNSRALFNPQGYAPGIVFSKNSTLFIALPGVPREFSSMISLHLPGLLNKDHELVSDFIIRTKEIGEEKIFNELDPSLWEKLQTFGSVASLPYLHGVDLTVRLKAQHADEMEEKKNQLKQFILGHPLAQFIWHIGSDSLEECIIKKAQELGVRFGFAESCTGGLCSDKITNVNGSSSVFYGSVICYHQDIKVKQLGVDPATIEKFDVVSGPVALQMAQGLRQLYPIDIAVSITGHAGPHANQAKIPTGTVYIGISCELGDFTSQLHFVGERTRLKESFYQMALFQLLETLEKLALR